MIIITGSILARPETCDELRRLSIEHTQRSRAEGGCEHHAVHIDAENGLRLVFIERWTDRAAVLAHFAEPPTINIYTGEEVSLTTLIGS